MAAQKSSNSSALLAAAAGLGVALVAGAVTIAFAHKDELGALLGAPAAKPRRAPPSSAGVSPLPAATPAPAAKRADVVALAKRRRATWLAASNTHGLSLDALSALYLKLRGGIEGDSEERFQRAVRDVDRDVHRTACVHPEAKTPEFQAQLRNVLLTLARFDPEVGYVQGLNFLAAFVLVVMRQSRGVGAATAEPDAEEADTFTLLVRLLRHPRYAMRECFTPGLPRLHVLNAAMSRAIATWTPGVQAVFDAVDLSPLHLHEWWFTLGTYVLPWPLLGDVWDAFFVEGWAPVARLSLGLLHNLGPYLEGQRDLTAVMTTVKGYGAHLSHGAGREGNPPPGASSVFTLAPPADIVAASNARFADVTPAVFNGLLQAAQAEADSEAAAAAAAAADATPSPAATPAELEAAPETPAEQPAAAAPMGSSVLGESWMVVEPGAGGDGTVV